jgi:undecaprenyl-diphosphatase
MADRLLTPEEEQVKEQAKQAVRKGIAAVDSPEKAEQVLTELEAQAGTKKETEVAEATPTPASAEQAAEAIQQTAAAAPPDEMPKQVIAEAAAQVAASSVHDEPVIAQAVQEAINPESAAETPVLTQQRQWLRDALLKRLDPANGADVRLFLAVNHLPHTKLLNRLMYGFTMAMTGGHLWMLGLALYTLTRRKRRERRHALRALTISVPSLLMSTLLVDYPIKYYFRRRRPFINIVRAVVVGRKPGSYSFPSGHTASSFAGAVLLSHYYPKRSGIYYAIASLVGFSRIYVGAHYPGDVLSGGTLGVIFATAFRLFFRFLRKLQN